MRIIIGVGVLCLVTFFAAPVPAAETGRIEGRVLASDGRGHGGLEVSIPDLNRRTLTDTEGRYGFRDLPAGTYTLLFVHRDQVATRPGIVVTAGQTTTVDLDTDWELTIGETITVTAASRREERVIDAPSAVTVIDGRQIRREASPAQFPKIVEFTPGAEVTQSGIYDYNLNTRGFNSSLTRRVAVLVDGRDVSVPSLGAQQWASMPPLDDVESVEFLRGPSAALYGANASSGVLNVTTREPRDSQGLSVRAVAGELSTTTFDFRYAGSLGNEWYWKVNAGARNHDEFNVSRNFDFTSMRGRAEYSVPCSFPAVAGETDCLPQEVVPLREDDDRIHVWSLRADKYMARGDRLTLEGGQYDGEGRGTAQTGIGRFQVADDRRPWARIEYSSDHWNVLTYYSGRRAKRLINLASGTNAVTDGDRYAVEAQTHWTFGGNRGRIVGGATYTHEEIDSFDKGPDRQTLFFEPIESDRHALFGQVDYQVLPKLKLVIAGRFDESSLHDSRISPKAALVYSMAPGHSLRFTYNEAFQVANYSEFFLYAPAAAPSQWPNLSGLQAICDIASVNCGFGITPILAVGNETLDVEQTEVFEVGYTGILLGKAFLTIDYYRSKNKNFISDLVFQRDPASGKLTNRNYGPWEGPAALPAVLEQAVRDTAAMNLPPVVGLTNGPDGSNIIAAASYNNIGEVETQGVELGLQYLVTEALQLNFSYSWFDFDITDAPSAQEDQLLPNSPENQVALGLAYVKDRFDLRLSGRWVDDFRWATGVFQGDVESYTTVDFGGSFRFDDHWEMGINVANLFDNEHWEAFGGDLIGRRALAHASYRW